jgi:hypothetical protein
MKNEKKEWLYHKNKENTFRYVIGENGKKIVACIGINPSTAEPNNLDNTLKSVKRISKFNNFDGWIMYNLYPQRATNPSDLDNEINHTERIKNFGAIRLSIKHLKIDTIWVAWGDLIEKRKYIPYCLSDLYSKLSDLNLNWKIIGNPTKKGHPRHPLYKKTKSEFIDFDIEKYINEKIKSKAKGFDKTYIDGIEFK